MNAPVPHSSSLAVLRDAALGCRACDLYRNATQTVFGEGPRTARIVAVGEQPGDQEDRQGHPFVGPAGKILARAFRDAHIDDSDLYVTNAVKHFKFEPRGKRRIHQKPNMAEIQACRPWLAAEIGAVKPELILCLGVTAAHSVFERRMGINENRGKFLDHPWARAAFITVHPSAILRVLPADRDREYQRLVDDLAAVHDWLRARSVA
jgi:uracil-DNA glycosylase